MLCASAWQTVHVRGMAWFAGLHSAMHSFAACVCSFLTNCNTHKKAGFLDRPCCSWIAAGHGHLEIARMCIEHGADVNHTEENGTPPLMIACRYGHADMVSLLLEVRCTAMGVGHVIASCLAAHLLASCVDHSSGCTCLAALLPASEFGSNHPSLPVCPILQHGADVHAIDSHGRNALIYAAGSGSASIVTALLQRGADVNQTDVNGACPLILATNGQHCHLVAPLLVRGDRKSGV